MTTRGQNLRSSTPGQTPAAGTRQPGEIWMTFPDIQLGYIDAARNAQRALAVRFFSTLANYATGDFVIQAAQLWRAKAAVPAGAFNASQWTQIAMTADIPALYVLPIATPTVLGGVKPDGVTTKVDAGGVLTSAGLVTVSATPPSPVQNGALWYDLTGGQLYTWVNDGTSSQWVIAVNQSLGGVYLPMSGGTLTGPLTLAGDPVNPLDAVTKQYADKGVTNGSDAAPGQVGEVISSVVAAPGNVLSSSIVTNIASIALTAGDWDVQGELILTVGATAAGILQGGISGTSLSMGNGLNGSRVCFVTTFPGGANVLPVRACRASLAAPATYYLVGYANVAGVSAAGTIWARRAR